MNTSQIYAALSEISIYLDESILEEIKKFIETFIGDSWQNNPKLCIYISTAVVG
jgi:lantibiotic modifying enzyme